MHGTLSHSLLTYVLSKTDLWPQEAVLLLCYFFAATGDVHIMWVTLHEEVSTEELEQLKEEVIKYVRRHVRELRIRNRRAFYNE